MGYVLSGLVFRHRKRWASRSLLFRRAFLLCLVRLLRLIPRVPQVKRSRLVQFRQGVGVLAVRPDVPHLVRTTPSGDPPLSKASSGLLELRATLTEAAEPCSGFLPRESFSMEIIESISPEDLQPTVKICVDMLQSTFICGRVEQFSWKKTKQVNNPCQEPWEERE